MKMDQNLPSSFQVIDNFSLNIISQRQILPKSNHFWGHHNTYFYQVTLVSD